MPTGVGSQRSKSKFPNLAVGASSPQGNCRSGSSPACRMRRDATVLRSAAFPAQRAYALASAWLTYTGQSSGQRNILKHCPIAPLAIRLMPENRMRNVLLRLPVPVGIAPQRPVLVAARIHELEILAVGDFVLIDRKCGHRRLRVLRIRCPSQKRCVDRAKCRASPGPPESPPFPGVTGRMTSSGVRGFGTLLSCGNWCSMYASVSACMSRCSIATFNS